MALRNRVDISLDIPANLHFPKFEKPVPVGVFGLNSAREYVNNADNLRYYIEPDKNQLPLNLNVGLETVIRKDANVQEGLNHLCSFIEHNYEAAGLNREITPQRFLPYDFVCYRGLLTLLGETPFENFNNWTILVTRFKGNYYLCRRKSEEEINAVENASEDQKRFSSWGYKFEQYCLSEAPNFYPDDSKPVNENEEFNCVFQTRLGPHRLLYAAEMDGVLNTERIDANDRQNLTRLRFIELKTRERNLTERKMHTFRNRKSLKWWLQSFFVGIDTIAVGLRNAKGLVQEVTPIQVNSLRKMAPQNWSGNQCFNFIQNFLDTVRKIVGSVDDHETTFVFSFVAEHKEIYYEKYEGWSDYTFLSNSYAQFVSEQYSRIKFRHGHPANGGIGEVLDNNVANLPLVLQPTNPIFVNPPITYYELPQQPVLTFPLQYAAVEPMAAGPRPNMNPSESESPRPRKRFF